MFKFFLSLLQRAFVAFVINCQIDGVSLGGWENFEQSKVFPSPYNPRPFQTLLGECPETPVVVEDALFYILYFIVVGFLGAKAPKRREEVGRGLRRNASVASRRGGETASDSVPAPLLKERS